MAVDVLTAKKREGLEIVRSAIRSAISFPQMRNEVTKYFNEGGGDERSDFIFAEVSSRLHFRLIDRTAIFSFLPLNFAHGNRWNVRLKEPDNYKLKLR